MKKLISIIVLAMSMVSICGIVFADQYVKPHMRKNGSYVQGHYRSDRDYIRSNNWTQKGNYNPHTGQPGTRW